MIVSDPALQTTPATGSPGWIDALTFAARKESWVASSAGWFYKIFRKSDDPARDWRDPQCMETARREYADTLLLARLSPRVCAPVKLDHACVVYPHMSGPDMRVMLQQFGHANRQQGTAALRQAMVVLAQLHAATPDTLDYPLKDYMRNGYLVPDATVAKRIDARARALFVGGFEVRNFRFDDRHNGWFFFDPQHVYLGMAEDSVARFVISLLMINWGQGGTLSSWQAFDVHDLLSAYEAAADCAVDRVLFNYFLRETIAMRRHVAEKALRNMHGIKRLFGRPYLAVYFLQLSQWAAKHEL